MIVAQNWPKTTKSSWHCSFKKILLSVLSLRAVVHITCRSRALCCGRNCHCSIVSVIQFSKCVHRIIFFGYVIYYYLCPHISKGYLPNYGMFLVCSWYVPLIPRVFPFLALTACFFSFYKRKQMFSCTWLPLRESHTVFGFFLVYLLPYFCLLWFATIRCMNVSFGLM